MSQTEPHTVPALAKVESVVEEYAMLLKSTPGNVQVLDGRSARTETSCRGYFDFDFLVDIGELAMQTIGLVEGFQSNQGLSSGTLQNTLPEVADALINVFKTHVFSREKLGKKKRNLHYLRTNAQYSHRMDQFGCDQIWSN